MSGSVSLVNSNAPVSLVNSGTSLIQRAPPNLTDLTWVGGPDDAASDPNDWSPTVAPASGDTLNMSSGTINITGNDLAGDPLTFVSPTDITPFQNNVVLANGSARLTDANGNDFTLSTSDSVASTFVGGNGVGFNGAMNLSPNGTTTLTGVVKFLYGVFVNPNGNNGSNFVNDGSVGLTHATLNADLSGTGTYDLTRYHDGPGMVEINGSVAAGLTFTMDGASEDQSVLTLDQPAAFGAQINVPAKSPEGTAGADTIHLQGLTATNYTLANGVFTLFDGTNVVDTLNLTTALPLTVDQDSGSVGLYFNLADGSSSATALPMRDAPASPFPLPATPPNFDISDMSDDQSGTSAGAAYTGPVPGLADDIIMATSDNINIDPTIPNVFIHTGSGNDAIDVSGVNGNNVLDGSTGTNFLTGGTGDDTFYVDARNIPPAPNNAIFDTINGFHSGDVATIWGIAPGDQPTTGNNVLPNASGLDFAWTLPGGDVNVNLTNYTTADLTNGRLSVSFGTSPDTPGLPGSPYMLVQAN